MDDPHEKDEVLIRRNRDLLAVAAQERGLSREARARIYETCHMSIEARRRAVSNRKRWFTVRAREKAPG